MTEQTPDETTAVHNARTVEVFLNALQEQDFRKKIGRAHV